jgi:hypothetical protein
MVNGAALALGDTLTLVRPGAAIPMHGLAAGLKAHTLLTQIPRE